MDALFPLKIPPGFVNNGTVYQAKGRWYTGNFGRFFQGAVQPIGGWVKRTLTGATISGTPNAAVAWQTNDGLSYLAIGTTAGLYVVKNSTNVVYDITPTLVSSGGNDATRMWQLDVFGTYLIAVSGTTVPQTSTSGGGFVWCWRGNTGVAAVRCDTAFDPGGGLSNDPYNVNGVVASPERFLFALRGDDPPATIRPASYVN